MNTSPRGCKNQSSNSGIESKNIGEINVRHITTDAEFDYLREDWIRLHQNCETAGLFNNWYWCRLWWQHYGDMGELFIVVVSEHDLVQGIAPFYRGRTKAVKLFSLSTLRFIGSGGDTSPDDLGLLYGNGYENIVSEKVCESLFNVSGCSNIKLTDLAKNSLFVKKLLSVAGEKTWSRPIEHQQHRRVDSLPDTVDLFETGLSKNARKQRRRRRRALIDSAESVKFINCQTHADVDCAYANLLRLHNMRQLESGGSDSFQSNRYREFHLAAMKSALDNNELRLMSLVIDGKTIGVEYVFLCKSVLSFFQTGFDPAFKHLSPGHLLMMETIDRGIVDGARRIDLLKGDYEYKQTYAKQTRTTINLELWKNPVIAIIVRTVRSLKSIVYRR